MKNRTLLIAACVILSLGTLNVLAVDWGRPKHTPKKLDPAAFDLEILKKQYPNLAQLKQKYGLADFAKERNGQGLRRLTLAVSLDRNQAQDDAVLAGQIEELETIASTISLDAQTKKEINKNIQQLKDLLKKNDGNEDAVFSVEE